MKTVSFTELVEKKMGKIFSEFEKNPEFNSYIVGGFPTAIAAYLNSALLESDTDESSLIIEGTDTGKILRFSLKAVKKGDSVSLVP
jgi:hypothetical protein